MYTKRIYFLASQLKQLINTGRHVYTDEQLKEKLLGIGNQIIKELNITTEEGFVIDDWENRVPTCSAAPSKYSTFSEQLQDWAKEDLE